MLSIRDLAGIEEPFVDFKGLKRKRKVNGERTISLTVLKGQANKIAFDMVEEESSIFFDEDEYVIKKMSERALGNTSAKKVEAIHRFYVDLMNKQQTKIHDGSITFNDYMALVFEDTGYTFTAIDQFYAKSFDNLGDDTRLSLLKKGLERFQAEMEVKGNQVRFYAQVGNDSDFQFRYGHNIKTIEREVDTTDLATVIRGKGDPELGIEAYYESPNVDIFGKLDAPSVSDKRFKSEESLLEEMKERLQDTPEFSITIGFVDLRAAGYPYTVPNEGDSVFIIYEPMKDLLIDTRILEIDEDFDINLQPIKTDVTLANYKKSFADTMFDNTDKKLKEIVNDDGVIRYNVLDEAVRIATEALQSAQTELIFDNGIIARDKEDPNRLVVYNSEGLGISSDGGQTFREAITADGFVLTAGAIGRLSANHIQIGPETDYDSDYDPSSKETPDGAQDKANKAGKDAKEHANSKDSSLRDNLRITSPLPNSISLNAEGITARANGSTKYARLDNRGLYIKGGAIQIDGGLSDNQVASSDKWNSTKSTVDDNKSKWDKSHIINSDGTLDVDFLKGKLTDNQLASAKKWNGQGTHIDNSGVYTGAVVADQITGGVIDAKKVRIQGGSGNSYTKIQSNFLESKGNVRRHWFDYNKKNIVRVIIEDGQIRARNDTQEWSLYFNDWGISTFKDGSGDDYDGVASGAIEFHSTRYHSSRGLTIFSGARLGLETNGGRVYINPNGASVRIADAKENFYTIHASHFITHENTYALTGLNSLMSMPPQELEASNLIKELTLYRHTKGGYPEYNLKGESVISSDKGEDEGGKDLNKAVMYLLKSQQETIARLDNLEGAV